MMKRWTVMLLSLFCAVVMMVSPLTVFAAEIGDDQTAATEPEVTEPEVTATEAAEPEVTEPEVTEPEVTATEAAEPEVTEPEVTATEAAEPEVTEPEVTATEAAEPEVTEPEVTEPALEQVEQEKPENTRAASTNGFVQNEDGTWSYYIDGTLVTSTVIYHNGSYYGFNYNGIMYDNASFSLYDYEVGHSAYYRAKEGGALYVNEWYYPYPDYESDYYKYYRYYYGEGGKAPYEEIFTVDNVQYYFYYNGRMMSDSSVTVDGKIYIADVTGALTELKNNGWTKVGEDWYYVKDGNTCDGPMEIGGVWYLFSDSKMLTDTDCDFYDEELGRWVYYRAKADGTLYVNEWYYPYPDYEGDYYKYYRYYYGEGGKAPYEEIFTVDNVQYYFYYNGRMMSDSSVTIDGKIYMADVTGALTQLNSNGWTKVGEDWYYVKDGNTCDGPMEIGGVWYMFSNSKMLKDISTNFYDEELGRWVYYRAKADGTLCVNEWYQPANSTSWYYYGAGGKAASGYTKIGGSYYYFNYNGRMSTNSYFEENGEYIITDKNGYAYKLNNNTWTQIGEDWYYVKDGQLAHGPVQIGSTWYMFSNGKMLKNTSTDFYDEALGRWVYYRAKADGTLYVNEWYQASGSSSKYYYGAGGKSAYGYTQVDGSYYYFEYSGRMSTNGAYQGNGEAYYVDSKGIATVLANNTWTKAGNYWYYVKDGVLCNGPVQIGGTWYLFRSGRMIVNDTYSAYDDELGRTVYYRSKADGTLYINEWFIPYSYDPSDAFYYGAGGKSAYGLLELGGKRYYFDYKGQMCTNVAVEYNGSYYVLDEKGNMTPMQNNAWTQIGGYWYYLQNGSLCSNGVYTINGTPYGFWSDGRMITDTSFNFNNSELGRYTYYRAKSDGTLYINAWYFDAENSGWYYYGEGGKSANGFTTVSGAEYYFDLDGRMRANEVFYKDGSYYIAGSNGAMHLANKSGWTGVDGEWYYFENGSPCYGVKEVGGVLYLFDNGRMTRNESLGYWDDEDERYYNYCSGPNGVLYQNQWVQPYLGYGDDSWYYYGEGGKSASGIVTINGTKYLFYDEGRLVDSYVRLVGDIWYATDANGHPCALADNTWTFYDGAWFYVMNGEVCRDNGVYEIGGAYYFFDWNGRMVIDEDGYSYYRTYAGGKLYHNEWYWNSDRGGWMYYGEDCCYIRGELVEIGGHYYYFDYNGIAAVNDIKTYDGATYKFDAKGYGTKLADGWVKHPTSNRWMYVQNGVLAEGLLKIGNVSYYFENGYMLTDRVQSVYNSAEDNDYYLIGKDGAVVTKVGWYTIDGRYVYVNATGKLQTGWLGISNKWYYMTPYMAHDTVIQDENGGVYVVDSKGVCTHVTKNGIYHMTYGSVYIENGNVVKNAWRSAGGYWYYFDENGYMLRYGVFTINGKGYLFSSDGKMWTGGWLHMFTDYYYAGSDGVAYVGVHTIGGVQYVFDKYGCLVKSGAYKEGNTFYFTDESGVVKTSGSKSGWYGVDGNWYYVKNGSLVSDTTLTLDGTVYGFNYNGVMYKDTITYCNNYYYSFGPSGKALGGWQKIDGYWYYANPTTYRMSYYGKYTIDGSTYYFDDGKLRTGTFVYDGLLITTTSGGAVVSSVELPEDYTYVDGQVYLGKNGEPYTGWLGDYYFSNGRMLYDTVANINGSKYYFTIYGNYIKNAWYQPWEYDTSWVLAKADGKLYCNEWYTVGKSSYYFDDVYMVANGTFEIDGVKYAFDKNGVCLGVASDESYPDGWQKLDGKWYYNHAGRHVIGKQLISGKWYVFDGAGRLCTSGIAYDYYSDYFYYVDASGAVMNYTGWQKINGEWLYFNDNNSVKTGWIYDGGKSYYCMSFNYVNANEDLVREAYLLTDTYLSEGGYLYYFDSTGVCKGTVGVENGWYQVKYNSYNSDWYYFENGKLVCDDTRIIDGAMYTFDISGFMVRNGIWYCDDTHECYFFDSNGKKVTKEGWMKIWDGQWIYVGKNGKLYNGIHKINGTVYYFRDYIWVG